MNQAFKIRPRSDSYQRGKPLRNERYKSWVRSHACWVCQSTRNVEAAHTGPHGLSQKASDIDVIPLCEECHRTGKQSLHKLGPVRFAAFHDLNVPAKIAGLQVAYIAFQVRREGVQ